MFFNLRLVFPAHHYRLLLVQLEILVFKLDSKVIHHHPSGMDRKYAVHIGCIGLSQWSMQIGSLLRYNGKLSIEVGNKFLY